MNSKISRLKFLKASNSKFIPALFFCAGLTGGRVRVKKKNLHCPRIFLNGHAWPRQTSRAFTRDDAHRSKKSKSKATTMIKISW